MIHNTMWSIIFMLYIPHGIYSNQTFIQQKIKKIYNYTYYSYMNYCNYTKV